MYQVGVTYLSAYWLERYTVLSYDIGEESKIPWSNWSVTVKWEDGRITTHCTDKGRDIRLTERCEPCEVRNTRRCKECFV